MAEADRASTSAPLTFTAAQQAAIDRIVEGRVKRERQRHEREVRELRQRYEAAIAALRYELNHERPPSTFSKG